MKNSSLLGLVALAAGAVYLLTQMKGDKKVVKVNEELDLETKNKTSRKFLTKKEKKSIDGLNFGMPITINRSRVKAPVKIPAANLVPDIYGRNVGAEVYFSGSNGNGFYHNMSGLNSEQIGNACQCAPIGVTYKTDIPKLP